MTTTKKLLDLKESIENAKEDKAKLTGKLESLYETLQTEFNCKTLASAQKKFDKLSKELETKQSELTDKIEEFEGRYEL